MPSSLESKLVSCIMPTANRRCFATRAIRSFQAQGYAERELLILDDGTDSIRDLIPEHPGIRYTRLDHRLTVGAKRNLACSLASGDIILHWDDDDWYADWRISYQVSELLRSQADICGLDQLLYQDQANGKAWQYRYPRNGKAWVAGNTLCYRRTYWQQHPFAEVNVGEDCRFVWQAAPGKLLRLANSGFVVGTVHPANVSRKTTQGSNWISVPVSRVNEIMQPVPETPALAKPRPEPDSQEQLESKPQALVAAARGIGDILRITPLVSALHQLGYFVDLLIRPDYPEIIDLLRPCPEIRTIFAPPRVPSMAYDVAVFSAWSLADAPRVQAERKLCFDREKWFRHGDPYCVKKMAQDCGWQGDLPASLARHSGRDFRLPTGTVALHPGCKPDWPWKKWHGFDELAKLMPKVVIVGSERDGDNRGTYFARDFMWPAHAQDFTGKLSLADTAALISQCSALVSNDSGLMHLGVALGVPTHGIFGITSPAREASPLPYLHVITKQLACEPACHSQSFGRRDCRHHLACLKTLTADEVLKRLPPQICDPPVLQSQPHAPPGAKETSMNTTAPTETLSLAYHGHIFDSTGYGHAARAYIHSLHSAGIDLSVHDLSAHAPQVHDSLVESLIGRELKPDFHLFHGIPSVWARAAFRLPNTIAMTVWETDTMPTQWRNTLNHALEVWLPCDFNVAAFRSQLARPVFKLPHAALPSMDSSPPASPRFSAAPEDFVFYSIFEWQDRKHPLGQIIAYYRAFPLDGPHLLICKTNPGARDEAHKAIAEARRSTGSIARAEIHCEAWSEPEVSALHTRGDCYLSLHRGEGWGYPLFEAACRGTPIVATAYSGPLEYLNAQAHQLVPYALTSVRQRYVFYTPRMHWADPDLAQAADRLRWVYTHREEAREKALAAAAAVKQRHTPEIVGELAKDRLLKLRDSRLGQCKRSNVRANGSAGINPKLTVPSLALAPPRPPQPVPADWYDADYFEHGLKSNWKYGYPWCSFQGLFRDTATFLSSTFPHAESFVDAGCAKGFLVESLRSTGKDAWGFDVSAWALANALPSAAPFLHQQPAESATWDRTFDLTLAFDLLSHLTEQQAFAFLQRARTWTSVALLAVIPLAQEPDSRDLSHVSLHGRDWWHELFLRAGWRKDNLHKVLESLCQQHPLPCRLGWDIFLYTPQ